MHTFQEIVPNLQQKRIELETAAKELYQQKQSFQLQQIKIKGRLNSEGILHLLADDEDQQLLFNIQSSIQEKNIKLETVRADVQQLEKDFDELGNPQQIVRNLNDGIPVLLMPLRIQTRFVTVKHIARGISKDYLIDCSKVDSDYTEGLSAEIGDWSGKELKLISTVGSLGEKSNPSAKALGKKLFNLISAKKLRPVADKWMKQTPDQLELWVRIYPDDIFLHAHESHLTPQEKEAGELFWRRWWDVHRSNPNALAEEHADTSNNTEKPLTAAWKELQNAFGPARAAWIFRQTQPSNYTGVDTNYEVAPQPQTDEIPLKSDVWTEPLLSFVMPDRFVVRLQQGELIKEVTGNRIPHPFKLTPAPEEGANIKEGHWMHDFDEAEKIGLAIRINLSEIDYKSAKKIDKIIVLGVKSSVGENDGQGYLEDLFENHHYKHGGMAILPQGTPTNNFEKTRSGYSPMGLPAEAVFKAEAGNPLFEITTDWRDKKDGQYLTEALGINPAVFQHIHCSSGQDISNAIAMNHLLWPATLGYYLEQFLQPTLKPEDIENTRNFLLQFVNGRGFVPAFRVGKQPYSILPTTAFSLFEEQENSFISNLYNKALNPLDRHWQQLASRVKQITDPDFDLQKFSNDFIRILSLSANSEEVYLRPQIGKYFMTNAVLAGLAYEPRISGANGIPDYIKNMVNGPLKNYYRKGLLEDFAKMNLFFEPKSRLFEQHFSNLFRTLKNPLIDSLPVSEERNLLVMEGLESAWNYLEWLEKTPIKDFQATHFQREPGAPALLKPTSLLYLMARQALSRAYIQTAVTLLPKVDKKNNTNINAIDLELEHLNDANGYEQPLNFLSETLGLKMRQDFIIKSKYSQNKWSYQDLKIGKPGDEKFIWQYMEEEIPKGTTNETFLPIFQMKSALSMLKDQSTASLQRLFTEHLDLCHYRLDSWMCGLANHRLHSQRAINPQGLYLGAYGYIENLNKENTPTGLTFRLVSEPRTEKFSLGRYFLTTSVAPVLDFKSFAKAGLDLDNVLSNMVLYLGEDFEFQIERSKETPEKVVSVPTMNPNNQGFMHTPSLSHATTAAILRSGFMANNPVKTSDEFAINLSSERVRKALYYMEGLRHGQELPALLGYQFERELHDNPMEGLDQYLLEFRRAYPMKANKLPESESGESTETKEAFNVVDGLKLVETYRNNDENIEVVLKGIHIDTPAAKTQIKRVIEHLDQSLDAISDLLVSESIFQIAKGNLGKSAGVLKMLDNDKEIEIPEIISSPRWSKFLSHVVGIQFDLSKSNVAWPGRWSPRSIINPYLNNWLGEQLPYPYNICVNVNINGNLKILSFASLAKQPLDFISFFQGKNALSETSELTYFFIDAARSKFKAQAEDAIKIEYNNRAGFTKDQKSIYELKPLIGILLKLVANSRPMLPTDLELSSRTNPVEKESYSTLETELLISRFDDVINGTNYFSIRNQINNNNIFLEKARQADLPPTELQSNYELLQKSLIETTFFIQTKERYNTGWEVSPDRLELLIKKGETSLDYFQSLLAKSNTLLSHIRSLSEERDKWEGIQSLSDLIFGHTLKVFPEFKLINTPNFKSAFNFPDILADADEFAVEEWLQGISLVRDGMSTYHKLELFREIFALSSEEHKIKVLQLPFSPNTEKYRWLGASFPPETEVPGEALSLAIEFPKDFEPENVQSGMIIDFWTESIPEKKVDTGIALHYDQANSEPPQTILLCVTPKVTGHWNWESLMTTITDTIEMAKKRAVEPDLIAEETGTVQTGSNTLGGRPLAFILPALSFPVSTTENTPCFQPGSDLE